MLGEVRSARWLPGWYVKWGGEGPGELTLPCSIETKAAAYILKDPQVPSCQSPAGVFETPSSSREADGRGSRSLWALLLIFWWMSLCIVIAQQFCSLCSPSPASGSSFTPLLAWPGLQPCLSQELSPPSPSVHWFWKSRKDRQDLYGVLASTGRFFWTLFPFFESLSGSLKEMPPILLNLHVC